MSRFNRVSIFSDLNNLTDISLQPEYAEICGITQEELEANFKTEIEILAEENEMTTGEALTALKKKYDGYVFTKKGTNLYNPFSVLNALNAKDLGNYWFSTGTPTFLIEYLKEGHYNIPDLDGNIMMDSSGLEKYRADEKNPLPILFQTGYLTIKDYNTQADLYRLGFPNDEVRYAFLENLVHPYLYMREHEAPLAIWNFYEDIQAGRIDEFMTRIRSIISDIPYDDFTEEKLKLREQNYQTAVYLIFALMGQFVQTEVICATGRADCIVETQTAIYIFEFKVTRKSTAEDALKQIEETRYADKYKSHGKKIIMIGTAFDEKTKTIGEYLIKNYQ